MKVDTSFSDKDLASRCARVYIREARSRRGSFRFTLQSWAANQRRKYYEIVLSERKVNKYEEIQLELFL